MRSKMSHDVTAHSRRRRADLHEHSRSARGGRRSSEPPRRRGIGIGRRPDRNHADTAYGDSVRVRAGHQTRGRQALVSATRGSRRLRLTRAKPQGAVTGRERAFPLPGSSGSLIRFCRERSAIRGRRRGITAFLPHVVHHHIFRKSV